MNLYYERRTNQFNSDDTVLKSKIVSIPHQIKTFSSMFLDLPHVASGYFGTIMRNHGNSIFLMNQSYYPYYISTVSYYRLEGFFKSSQLSTEYRKAKYQLLMLFKYVIDKGHQPQLTSKRIESYCKNILDILKDSNQALTKFKEAIAILDKNDIDINDRNAFKSGDTTAKLLEMVLE